MMTKKKKKTIEISQDRARLTHYLENGSRYKNHSEQKL